MTASMIAAGEVGPSHPAFPACIHATPPVVQVHRLPTQVAHLHLTRDERAACEWDHAAQSARLLLAGEVA